MTKALRVFAGILCLFALVVFLVSCENETPPSFYDSNYTGAPTPKITSVVPPDSALAGIGQVTILGENFSPRKEENFVYFDKQQALVLSASATQLDVRPPNVIGDTIVIKIAVHGALAFSNTIRYKLKPAVSELVKFGKTDEPWAIACDSQGNVYVSLTTGGAGMGVKKVTPDGVLSDYAPKGGETYWSALKVGPGGTLYGVRQVRAIFQIPAGGGAPTSWMSLPTSSAKLADLDFDRFGNLWVGGNNPEVYRVKPDKSVKAFPFTANVRSVRVFNDYLYLAAERNAQNKIWRFPILPSGDLGAEEEYFDFSAAYPGFTAFAITFSTDGDMYVGTDAPEAIVVVHPSKSYEPLYPGLFKPTSLVFAWGIGTHLYVTRKGDATAAPPISQTILKINTLKRGAPYYGRGDT